MSTQLLNFFKRMHNSVGESLRVKDTLTPRNLEENTFGKPVGFTETKVESGRTLFRNLYPILGDQFKKVRPPSEWIVWNPQEQRSVFPNPLQAYQEVRSVACYAPWNLDKEFLALYGEVFDAADPNKSHTLIDLYRCYELWTITKEILKLPKGAFLEVGVWRGGSSLLIAKQIDKAKNQDPIYLCDTFEGVANAGTNDSIYKGGEHSDTSLSTVEALFKKQSVNAHFRILKGIFPEQTSHLVPSSEIFRFCHVDVDVYESAKQTTEWVWPKLVSGGIVVFDDYGFMGCDGVTKFVNEFKLRPDLLFIHNLNGHAIFVKK